MPVAQISESRQIGVGCVLDIAITVTARPWCRRKHTVKRNQPHHTRLRLAKPLKRSQSMGARNIAHLVHEPTPIALLLDGAGLLLLPTRQGLLFSSVNVHLALQPRPRSAMRL